MNEHKISLNILLKELKSSAKGLSTEEAKRRLNEYGPNILEVKENVSVFLKFLKQFTNFFAILLLIGSFLSFFAEFISPGEGSLYIGIALLSVVVLNAIFTFIQQYQSEKIMDSFKKMLPSNVDVLRDGKKKQILRELLVPGDIIFLQEGDKVPADGRLIDHNAMKVDNSSITGESEPQLRKLECTHTNILESRNMVFSGTLVQTGNGTAIVYSTGMNTEIGKIVRLTKETKETETTLHKELKYFIKVISAIAIFLGASFFIVGLFLGQQFMASLVFAIGIIVANVPEGLLPTVTLCLTIAAKKMAKKNALVKNLESIETLGSTTVICTDKTGTLTQNRISVNTLLLDLDERNIYEKDISKNKNLPVLLQTMVLCNNSRMENSKYLGDPTETSLMDYAAKHINVESTQHKFARVHESPFDSKTKRMISTNRVGSKKIAFMKGAPEIVLGMCNSVQINNKSRAITAKDKSIILKKYEQIASRGERVLAFAYKETKEDKVKEKEFIFIGLCGMIDPPRKEVPDAILKCRSAGIKVIMITGDYSLTAEAIARKVGLVNNNDKATIIIGEDLEKLSDQKLKMILKKENIIFARTDPLQKLKIVQALQAMGEVVTVTGDGVNDAPAIKNADMGVSMGISGTEVARESSKMVLMDDNFATIVNAIEEGRTIFANIKKFIAYILTSNVPEILPFLAFAILNVPLALTVILILAIDLGTDLLPAIGLGTEASETDVMSEKPRSRKERLLTNKLLFISYGIIGVIQAAAGFFSFFYILIKGGWTYGAQIAMSDPLYQKAVTAFFASIVICQIADVLICRTRRQSIFNKNFFANKIVFLGIAVELLLLTIIMYAPMANKFLGTAPLTLFELSLSIPFALIILFGDELRKFFVRRNNRFVHRFLTW